MRGDGGTGARGLPVHPGRDALPVPGRRRRPARGDRRDHAAVAGRERGPRGARRLAGGRDGLNVALLLMATDPGAPDWPNEDYACAAAGAAVLLGGFNTVPRARDTGCPP